MGLDLVRYFKDLEIDYLADKLAGKLEHPEATLTLRYRPMRILQGNIKIIDIQGKQCKHEPKTLFSIEFKDKKHRCVDYTSFIVYHNTPQYDFYFRCAIEHRYKNNVEWFKHDKRLQRFISRHSKD